MKYCSECGNGMNDTALFCEKCGTKFSISQETQATNLESNQILSTKILDASITPKRTNKILMIFLWVFFLPIMTIIFVAKSRKLKPSIKAILISLILIICIVVGVSDDSSGTPTVDNTSNHSYGTNRESEVSSDSVDDIQNKADDQAENKIQEDDPNIELKNDYEKTIWSVINDNGGILNSIASDDMMADTPVVSIEFSCKNNVDAVETIIEAIKLVGVENTIDKMVTICVKDIDEKIKSNLVIADILTDGTIDMIFESPFYNSKHNLWIKGQFSSWDGSHSVLKELIIKNLNDEKSFKHIETSYTNVNSEENKKLVNSILKEAGYSARVEINDLFITTTFSAKNSFNGTIKNTAYGIASYSTNEVTLIDIQ